MSTTLDPIPLGMAAIKKRAKVLFILFAVFTVIAPFGLVPQETAGASAAEGIAGCVLFAGAGFLFLFFAMKERKNLRNPVIVKRYGDAFVAKLSMTMPDIDATNEFKIRLNAKNTAKVWLNKETGQIQFLLPKDGRKSLAFFEKRVPMAKSKIVELSNLKDVSLLRSAKTITHYGGYGINPMSQSTLVAAGGTKTEHVQACYEVDFVFDDIDLPFVAVYFGSDDVEAKRLYHGMRTLCRKEYHCMEPNAKPHLHHDWEAD